MNRKLLLIVIMATLVSSCGFKNRKGYYYDNHRFNFVRVEDFKEAPHGTVDHPYKFSEPEISTILKMVEIKKGSSFTEDEKEKTVFDSYSIGKLTPPIVKAFSEITPNQRIAFAFMIKDPAFVLKNDRLSNGWMWVEDGKLHIEFDMIYVKVTADTDKRGYDAMHQQLAKSRGLRVALDLQPGQEYGSSTKEIVVDTKVAAMITEERLKKEEELAQKGVIADVKIEEVNKVKGSKERLKELDTLKKERMITEEEYQQKRKEILGEL